MTTSGSYSFNYNRDQIIRRAGRLVGAIASGEIPDANITQDFSDALNGMVKRWGSTGLHLWKEQEAILFTQPNQVAYNIGASSTDNVTTAYNATTTTLPSIPTATTITVASVAGIVDGINIGVMIGTGMIQWTTVSGAPVGSVVTLASALTDSVLASSPVYTFAARLQRPRRVLNARRYNFASRIETPMMPMLSRLDYMNLPNKMSVGTPTQMFYDPQMILGVGYIWPAPADATNGIKITCMSELQDFVVAGDTPDFPVEWIDPLVFNLALAMAPEFGTPTEQYDKIKEGALSYLDTVSSFDREPESIYVGVNMDQR